MQQITSKMKAEKASTVNLKDTHINTRLSHSFPICPKKWKVQKCLLEWGAVGKTVLNTATGLKTSHLKSSFQNKS